MDKNQIAVVLDEMGTLLELKGENAFRCNAYHNAARALEQLETNLGDLIATGKLGEVPGIGTTMREAITAFYTKGTYQPYEDLKKKLPPGLPQMLRVQGLGPKKVKALYDQLGIDSLEKLQAACEANQVAGLKGFGAKTQQKILEGIAFLSQLGARVRIDQALPVALDLLAQVRQAPGVLRSELCGSLRRRKETIKDIDILVSAEDPKPVMERFVKLPQVVQITGHGDTKSSVTVAVPAPGGGRALMNADLRVVKNAQFPSALHHFSGSKEHNIAMRSRGQQRGIKINEYEILGPDGPIPCREEADVFRALDLDYVPPEMREDTGELVVAEQHRVPKLIELSDLQGTFHCHTTASDGNNTLEEMAEAARALGFAYLGIGDHSQSLTVANGLTPERVRQQQKEIDALNKKLKGFHVFKGTECDILFDGRLDFDDDLLATFDYVVASVHSHFNLSEEEMTARMVKAVSHPRVTMLGHATGRLLLRRDGYKVDLEAVLKAAAEHGTMIEINAHPQRLDLDWVHVKRAKALGVKLVINPDAHHVNDLAYVSYGVDVARRGWLEKADVFNTLSLDEVKKELAARKKKVAKK
jgi:DNA polymerase (family X)